MKKVCAKKLNGARISHEKKSTILFKFVNDHWISGSVAIPELE